MHHKEVREQYQKLLDKLAAIMHPINDVAMAQSKFRCPYRTKDDLCTAKFGCRNQRKGADWIEGSAFTCAHDNKLDYRNFWEMPGERLGEPERKNKEKSN